MQQLATAQSLSELKYQYRRLAAIHHPDRGGCSEQMQRLNNRYEQLHLQFISKSASAANQDLGDSPDFSQLCCGDLLYINNTLSEVLEVSDRGFRVVAKGRARQAWFDLDTGLGLFNNRLQAGFTPRSPTRH